MMTFSDKNLNDLARIVFSDKYQFSNGPHKIKGKSGRLWSFDAIVENEQFNRFGIFIRDWKREISITQLRQLHKACIDSGFQGGIMICNQITDFSKDYSSQFGLQIFSRGHLISMIRRRQFQF